MAPSHNSDIDQLILLLSKLPGLGPRSARRAVLHLIRKRESLMQPLSRMLEQVATNTHQCDQCGNLDTTNPCAVCTDARRDKGTICVVEDVADLWALDRSGHYKGLYHVLGGSLSALEGRTPDDLNIHSLITRAAAPEITEIILATSATVDGQTTAHYIIERLKDVDVTITAIAHGVPVGGELDYLDDGTLSQALKARKPY